MEGHRAWLANAHGGSIIRYLTLFLFLLLAPTAWSAVLELHGPALGPLLGRDPAALELARYANGGFQSVPHQWIAWSDGRQPYFDKDKDAERQLPTNRIGAGDRLLLRDEDAGAPRPGALPDNVVATLTLGGAGPKRTLYVLDRPPFQGFPPAVTLTRSPLAIYTAHYRLNLEDDNLFQWGDFLYDEYQPPADHGPSLLDSLKLRLSAGVFSAGARLTLTNENLDPIIREVIEGPLATLVYATTRVRVAGLPVLTVHNYFILMDNAVAVHSRLTIPGFAAAVLREPSARVTVDGNALEGARLRTSWTGDLEARVDGRLSDPERDMMEQPVGRENWLWFGTGRGFDLLARLHFADGFDTAARFIYQDDPALDDEPERFPGQRPNVGFRLQGLPFGDEFYFVAELYFSRDSHGLSAAGWARRQFAPPAITVNAVSR